MTYLGTRPRCSSENSVRDSSRIHRSILSCLRGCSGPLGELEEGEERVRTHALRLVGRPAGGGSSRAADLNLRVGAALAVS